MDLSLKCKLFFFKQVWSNRDLWCGCCSFCHFLPHYLVHNNSFNLFFAHLSLKARSPPCSVSKHWSSTITTTTPFALALLTALLTGSSFKRKAFTVWIVLAMISSDNNLASPCFLDFKKVTSLFVASFPFKQSFLCLWTVCFERVGYVN